MDLLADADVPVLAAGLALVLLSLVGLLTLLVRRRRSRATDAEQAQPEADAPQVDAPQVAAEPAQAGSAQADSARAGADLEEPGRSLEVRTLLAQVHCLEEALAQAPDPAEASYRVQVRATLRAVAADCAPGADARYVVDRLAAALDRLDQPGGLTRPALPVVRGAELDPPVAPEVPVARAMVAVAPPAEEDRPAALLELAAPVELAAPLEAEALPVPDEHVVPVPPPAQVEPRRQRRRLRRSAA